MIGRHRIEATKIVHWEVRRAFLIWTVFSLLEGIFGVVELLTNHQELNRPGGGYGWAFRLLPYWGWAISWAVATIGIVGGAIASKPDIMRVGLFIQAINHMVWMVSLFVLSYSGIAPFQWMAVFVVDMTLFGVGVRAPIVRRWEDPQYE